MEIVPSPCKGSHACACAARAADRTSNAKNISTWRRLRMFLRPLFDDDGETAASQLERRCGLVIDQTKHNVEHRPGWNCRRLELKIERTGTIGRRRERRG